MARAANLPKAIDAVLMALPVHWHSVPSLDAVLHGKHIYHENMIRFSLGMISCWGMGI